MHRATSFTTWKSCTAIPQRGYQSSATRWNSMASVSSQQKVGGVPIAPLRSSTPIDFSESRFSHKSGKDMVRTILLFNVCKVTPLVKRANKIIKVSRSTLGDKATDAVLKKTFFRQFCGGENLEEAKVVINNLRKYGVGAVVDYAAEGDVGATTNAEVFDYNLARKCDSLALSAGGQERGFAAIKVTSLARPDFLQRLNDIVKELGDVFDTIAQTEEAERPNARVSKEQFTSAISSIIPHCDKTKAEQLYKDIVAVGPADMKDSLSYSAWRTYFSPDKYGDLGGIRDGAPSTLTDDEVTEYKEVVGRLNKIAEHGEKLGNGVGLVDAEQTYMQAAMDDLCYRLMRKYNKNRAIMMNTYQAYLKVTPTKVAVDCALAEQEGWKAGVKLVRGAYMYQERQLAEQQGRESPICDTKDATHQQYDSIIEYLLDRTDKVDCFFGTHNEASVKSLISGIYQRGKTPQDVPISVGQLLGMCDHITYKLAEAGIYAVKCVPFGPIKEVLPYLIRRAEENSDMLGTSGRETLLLLREVGRRCTGSKVNTATPSSP